MKAPPSLGSQNAFLKVPYLRCVSTVGPKTNTIQSGRPKSTKWSPPGRHRPADPVDNWLQSPNTCYISFPSQPQNITMMRLHATYCGGPFLQCVTSYFFSASLRICGSICIWICPGGARLFLAPALKTWRTRTQKGLFLAPQGQGYFLPLGKKRGGHGPKTLCRC